MKMNLKVFPLIFYYNKITSMKLAGQHDNGKSLKDFPSSRFSIPEEGMPSYDF